VITAPCSSNSGFKFLRPLPLIEVFTQTIFSELREDSRYLATIKLKLGLQESALYYAELPKNLRIQDSGLVKKINEVSKGFDKAYKISVSDSRTFEQDLLAQITTLNYQLNDLQMKL